MNNFKQQHPVDPVILANAMITPDGTIIQSFGLHDYKKHTDKNGFTYMVDGGLGWYQRTRNNGQATRIIVTSDHSHLLIREWFLWGSYGKDGNELLHWLKIKDMTTEYIQNIIDEGCALRYDFVFKNEIGWRKYNDQ